MLGPILNPHLFYSAVLDWAAKKEADFLETKDDLVDTQQQNGLIEKQVTVQSFQHLSWRLHTS